MKKEIGRPTAELLGTELQIVQVFKYNSLDYLMTMQEMKNALKLSKPIYLFGKSGTYKTTLLKQIEHAIFVSIQDIHEFDDFICV